MKRRSFIKLAAGFAALAAVPSFLRKPLVEKTEPKLHAKGKVFYFDLEKDTGGIGTLVDPYGILELQKTVSGDIACIKGSRQYSNGWSLSGSNKELTVL